MISQPNKDRTTTPPKDNDVLQNVNISNFMQEATAKVMADLRKKREKLIFDRLRELNINIDIETEQRRRFKSLSIEYSDNEEIIYYNDGSEMGLRVITFVTKRTPFDVNDMSIGYETSYY